MVCPAVLYTSLCSYHETMQSAYRFSHFRKVLLWSVPLKGSGTVSSMWYDVYTSKTKCGHKHSGSVCLREHRRFNLTYISLLLTSSVFISSSFVDD